MRRCKGERDFRGAIILFHSKEQNHEVEFSTIGLVPVGVPVEIENLFQGLPITSEPSDIGKDRCHLKGSLAEGHSGIFPYVPYIRTFHNFHNIST